MRTVIVNWRRIVNYVRKTAATFRGLVKYVAVLANNINESM